MIRRIIDLPIWHHPKLGITARIAVGVVALELFQACGDVYSGRVIGASLASDVFTSFIPMTWLPSAIGLGILANKKTQSLVLAWMTGILAAIALLAASSLLVGELGLRGWL